MSNPNIIALSFVVPCYKSAEVIAPLLWSLILQKSNQDFEVIFVIDDRDKADYAATTSVIGTVFSKIDNNRMSFRILTDTTHSIGGARNIGTEAARGKYVWYVDSDDWLINPKAIDIVLDAMQRHPDIHVALCKFACIQPAFNPKIVVWARIAEKTLAARHPFPANNAQEDNVEAQSFWQDEDAQQYINIPWPLYYYNWPRPGSVTNGKILS